jgi:hypothetical protein
VPLGARAGVRASRAGRLQLGHGPQWQIETDPARTSEVEVRFLEEPPDRTRIELEHRKLHHHGEGWEQIRESVASDGGWLGCLRAFAERMAA